MRGIFLLFSANRWEAAVKIETLLASGVHIVMDRYSYSGVAFSAAKPGMTLEWCWQSETVVKPQIEWPSVLLVDNLDSHVSEESTGIVSRKLYSQLCPLPPNSTSIAQPLDVRVMSPLKKKTKAAWLVKDRVAKPTAAKKRSATIHRTTKMFNERSIGAVQSSFATAFPVANV